MGFLRVIDGLVCLVFGFFDLGIRNFYVGCWILVLDCLFDDSGCFFCGCVFDFGDLSVWVFKGFVCFALMVLVLIV